MPRPLHVLLLEDNVDDARLIVHELHRAGFEPLWERVETENEFLAQLSPGLDVILADYRQPQFDALRALDLVRGRTPDVPVILVTGALGDEAAVNCLKHGAFDYLLKDRLAWLGKAVINALDHKQSRIDERRAREALADLNAQLLRRLERLAALRQIDMAITASLDLRLSLNVCLDQVLLRLQVDAADILLYDPHTRYLDYATGKGFHSAGVREARVRLDHCGVGRVVRERCPLHVADLSQASEPFVRAPLFAEEQFVAYHAVPLLAKGQVRGVLEVFERSARQRDPEWLDFLETLAGQAAIAVDNACLFEGLQRATTELIAAYDATIEGWSRALDLRDKETEGHSQRVTELTIRGARMFGLSDTELVHVRRGALLHDIGKMGVPDAILNKPGPLDADEQEVMRRHPCFAYEWLAPIAFLRPALDIPYCHHEKWDGTGYPRGLKAEQIPLAARIFAAADIWDALRSDRPYRKAWPEERVCEHLLSLGGTHLDPDVLEAILPTIRPVGSGATAMAG